MRPIVRRATGGLALACLAGCGAGVPGAAFGMFLPAQSVTLPLGARPTAIVTANFDTDARLDIALADRGNDSVIVMRGGGDGTFGFPIEVPLGPGEDPVALVAADFDRDTRIDLAVADRGGNDVAFLRGTGGAFSFVGGFALDPGALPSGIVAEDFDGDGKLDVVVSNEGRASVSIALGFGDGTFGPIVSFPIGTGFRPSGIATDDFDHDGRLDLAVANGADGQVAILLGLGDGTFGPAAILAVGTGSLLAGITIADVDRDGALDVVVANRTAGEAAVLLGNGDGTFGAPAAFHAGPGPLGIVVADIDRDGEFDLVVAVTGTGSASLLLGHGDGTFEPGFLFGTAGTGTRSVAVGDVNDDGNPDVVVADETSGSVGVLLQK